MLNTMKKILTETQKLELITTDKGEIVLSQAQINGRCSKLEEIIKKLC